MKLIQDLKEFVQLLNEHEIEYLVVGGYAVGIYGFPRYTGDIDIWLGISDQNAEKIINILDIFGFSSMGLNKNDFLTEDMVFQFGFPPNRLDLMTSVTGLKFIDCFQKKNKVEFDGIIINFIDKKSLVENKNALGRPKDKFDLDNIAKE